MPERLETITPAYRAAMYASWPLAVWWGGLTVTGLEAMPWEGPVLLAGNHDSYWDTVTIGIAAMPRRQIRALAKSSLWKVPGLAPVLNGMGQIPIDRGKGDVHALDRAVTELADGACIGIFPEGTRSLGRELRARGGIGRLAERVPEATVVCVACSGTVDLPKFPRSRPEVRVEFFAPAEGGLKPGEDHKAFAQRLVDEIRARAPVAIAGSKRAARIAAGADPVQDAIASGNRPG
ncbi:MAG TPA: lysophospholipid acyltransferase family protein [Solirubrobacteraceae bacterium]|nr:lysophospholipid acyltransferase family protein [Solirubrobacteraceae bacterium]